ncbi:hypothetical protein JCM8097_005269 [Rhodosporidiobolus ruineniae]
MHVVAALTLAVALVPSIQAKPLVWHRKISTLFGDLSYIKTRYSAAFTFWVQLVNEPVKSEFVHLLDNEEQSWTVLMPNTTVWDQYLTGLGGNTTNIESLTTKEWRNTFTEIYPYFFFEGSLNTSAVPTGDTVVLHSHKKSPVGDWPLHIAFRREASLEPNATAIEEGSAFPYNGTFFSTPYGSGDVSIPDNPVRETVAQILSYMPTIPKNLSVTAADLGTPEWAQLAARVPAAAALETSYNYTLLLPPSSAITTALSGTDASLESFFHAHLVDSRLVLSSKAQPFTLYTGTEGAATSETITVGGRNATVVARDVLTNGIVVQVIDRALTNSTASTTTAHREL